MVNFENSLSIKVRKQIVEAISTYNMIHENDKVMVCCSGGKDSSILLALLSEIQRRAPFRFQIFPVMLDQKQPGFDPREFRQWVESLNFELKIIEKDTYSIVKQKVSSGVYCSLCSRFRRAILYDYAHENGFNKMALGHHRDDVNQTLLLNLFYTGKLSSMPPKLKSDDGRNILIRPLYFVSESDILKISADWEVPIMPCNLCGSQEGMKRQFIKKHIHDLEKLIPGIQTSMLKAQRNVKESQLADTHLWDFLQLKIDEKLDLEIDHFTGLALELEKSIY